MIDFTGLLDYAYEQRLYDSNYHGLEHWHQVEFNGMLLASKTGADITVVRLFALFHDCRRMDDAYDAEHGPALMRTVWILDEWGFIPWKKRWQPMLAKKSPTSWRRRRCLFSNSGNGSATLVFRNFTADRAGLDLVATGLAVGASEVDNLQVAFFPFAFGEYFFQVFLGLFYARTVAQSPAFR